MERLFKINCTKTTPVQSAWQQVCPVWENTSSLNHPCQAASEPKPSRRSGAAFSLAIYGPMTIKRTRDDEILTQSKSWSQECVWRWPRDQSSRIHVHPTTRLLRTQFRQRVLILNKKRSLSLGYHGLIFDSDNTVVYNTHCIRAGFFLWRYLRQHSMLDRNVDAVWRVWGTVNLLGEYSSCKQRRWPNVVSTPLKFLNVQLILAIQVQHFHYCAYNAEYLPNTGNDGWDFAAHRQYSRMEGMHYLTWCSFTSI